MRLTIPIFIAGAIDLKKEREQLMALSSEITSKYQNKGDDIVILMDSFETLGDKKDVHIDYIKNKADIVLFILDDKMGSVTEEEYILAEETFKSNKKRTPNNHVFLKEFDKTNPTTDIEHIQEVMNQYGSYYTIYKNQDDLIDKVEAKIKEFINKRIKQSNRIVNILKNIAFLTTIIALALVSYGIYRYLNPEPMLIFSGGGSVYNYIHENPVNGKTIDLRDYPRSVYINQASGSAWALLAEEAFREGEQKFHSICLSADRIDSTFMTEKNKAIFSKAFIIELFIGHDPLVVYVQNQLASELGYDSDGAISPQQLCGIIDSIPKKDGRLFSTSKTSGTLRTYQNIISKEGSSIQLEDSIKQEKCFLFFDHAIQDYMDYLNKDPKDKKPYVALGSQYYYPMQLENDFTRLTVTYDSNNDTIKKPICIYFIAVNNTTNGSKWYINQRIVDFLKEIGGNKLIDKKYWEEIEKGYITIARSLPQPFTVNDTTTTIFKTEIQRRQLLKSFEKKHVKSKL